MDRQPTDETIAVLGADEPNLDVLRGMPGHERQRFVPLLSKDEMQEGEVCIPELLDRASAQLAALGQADAVIGFWDFPISTLVPCSSTGTGCAGHPSTRS